MRANTLIPSYPHSLKALNVLLPIKRLFLPAVAILALIAVIPKFIDFGSQSPTPIEWLKMPGQAVDIDISIDGFAWVASKNGEVKKWDGEGWQGFGGDAIRVAAGPGGNIWIIDPQNQIYRLDKDRWKIMPGKAMDIAIGATGAIWMISTEPETGGYRVYKWGETDWVAEEAAGVRIAVGPKGNPWIINDTNGVFRLTRMVWKQAPDAAIDISIAANGVSWIVEPPVNEGEDGPVSAWGGKSWVRHYGALVSIATDARSYPWGINRKNEIFADSRSVALQP